MSSAPELPTRSHTASPSPSDRDTKVSKGWGLSPEQVPVTWGLTHCRNDTNNSRYIHYKIIIQSRVWIFKPAF